MIIAIDGPSASGKGTLARRLAAHLGYAHLDSGLLYRAVAAKLLEAGRDPADRAAAQAVAEALRPDDLERSDLRDEAVGRAASAVAAQPAVRQALLAAQRRFAERPPGAVVDGRDIGTVVFPDAEVKLFIEADLETRALRRHKELLERGETSIYARVQQEMQDRDARDSGRQASPLRRAEDATVIDTSTMDADAAFAAALRIVAARSTGRTP